MAVARRYAALAAVLSTTASGCFWVTTKDEGNRLRAQVADLQARMSKQEESTDARVKKLDEELDKATKFLQHNTGDLGNQIDQLSDEIAKLTGEVEDAKRERDELAQELQQVKAEDAKTIADLQARVYALEHPKPPETNTGNNPPALTKDQLFKAASDELAAGKLDDAARDFRLYVKKYPSEANADEAQFGLAESLARAHKDDEAITEFQTLIDGYPKSERVDDSFLEAGLAALDEKDCVVAGAYLGYLVQNMPKSPLVKQAKQKLEEIKKGRKKSSVCKKQ